MRRWLPWATLAVVVSVVLAIVLWPNSKESAAASATPATRAKTTMPAMIATRRRAGSGGAGSGRASTPSHNALIAAAARAV